MILRLKIAKELYDFLKTKIPSLPPFSYQLGINNNECFIFTNGESDTPKYFDKHKSLSYDLRLYTPKLDHLSQLKIVTELAKIFVSDEFKLLTYENKTWSTTCTYLNDKPNPNSCLLTLEMYNDVTQCYKINLTLILRKEL